MVNPGYIYESEITKSLEVLKKKYDFFCYKLVDTHSYDKASKGKLILPKALGDHFVLYAGKNIFIEEKSSRSKTSYAFKYIADHQIKTGLEISKHGDWYLFFICDRSHRGKHTTYVLDVETVAYIRNYIFSIGKASMKWNAIREHSMYVLTKQKGGIWDLEFLIKL